MVLTQSVSLLGHAHAGQRLAGHDPRPHVHAKADSSNHDRGHRHGPGDRHHHHDTDAEPETPAAPVPNEPLSDHDSDAFFVAGVEAVTGVRSSAGLDLDTSVTWLSPLLGDLVRSNFTRPQWGSRAHNSAPHYSCPLYVRHLTLLI
jgi:hypothetical protein